MSFSLQCVSCKNYRIEVKCEAFPDGIPDEIFTGQHDHAEPYPGDNGILFKPIKQGDVRKED